MSDLIEKLGGMNESDRCDAKATTALILRQDITEMVLTASLQVDGFLAEIDSETAQIRAVHDQLTDRRDTAVKHSTLGSAVGTGGGAVGSTLALVGNTASTAGSWVGATFGGVGAVYGFLGYFQQRGPKGCFPDLRENPMEKEKKDQCPKLDEDHPVQCLNRDPDQYKEQYKKELYKKDVCNPDLSPQPTGCSPRMLYQLFCPGSEGKPGFHSDYDPVINAYLGDGPQSRRGFLIQTWGKQVMDQEKKEENEEKAPDLNELLRTKKSFLFTSNTDPRKLSIDDLTERANKLADLRSVVARMNRDLSRLTEDLATELRCVLP